MPRFRSNDLEIAYHEEGRGPPVMLVHGFASSARGNWGEAGWIDTLTGIGRKVIALDCRGHGDSDKPHDKAAYGGDQMPADVLRLMDHLQIERADLMGYSMGGGISMSLIARHGERFSSAVLAGVGGGAGNARRRDPGEVARALSADTVDAEASPIAKGFRAFAESSGNDLQALAAVMSSGREPVPPEELAGVKMPVLVVCGEKDDLVGDPTPLVAAIPGAKLVTLPGKDHLTAVPDPLYKSAVVDFLKEHGLR